MEERLSLAASAAAERILVPYWRIASYLFIGLAFFGHLYAFRFVVSSAAPQGWQEEVFGITRHLSSHNFTLFALAVAFVGLIVLPFWEKIGMVAAMACLSWLARFV